MTTQSLQNAAIFRIDQTNLIIVSCACVPSAYKQAMAIARNGQTPDDVVISRKSSGFRSVVDIPAEHLFVESPAVKISLPLG